jgi:hypothetical protein
MPFVETCRMEERVRILLDTRTPECAVRSDRLFTASQYSDIEEFHSDLSVARNVNMSECALNKSSLRMTLNHRVPGKGSEK